ncbi:hypothetical protein [Ruegeria atlantica]|uniref:hypothetical protein n=1 Tax=Ruegeria atlantica TaxID=81569 RepID=UPI0024952227|nr:hypothetical protein [Ruegeria atlantica]
MMLTAIHSDDFLSAVWGKRARVQPEGTLGFGLSASLRRNIHFVAIAGADTQVFKALDETEPGLPIADVLFEEMDLFVGDDDYVVVVSSRTDTLSRHEEMTLAGHVIGKVLLAEGQPELAGAICARSHYFGHEALDEAVCRSVHRKYMH